MTGEEALLAYGYEPGESGRYVRRGRSTQQWKRVEGGWLRFEADGSPTPYKVAEAGEGRGGLDHANPEHHDLFDWLWPNEELARIYG